MTEKEFMRKFATYAGAHKWGLYRFQVVDRESGRRRYSNNVLLLITRDPTLCTHCGELAPEHGYGYVSPIVFVAMQQDPTFDPFCLMNSERAGEFLGLPRDYVRAVELATDGVQGPIRRQLLRHAHAAKAVAL